MHKSGQAECKSPINYSKKLEHMIIVALSLLLHVLSLQGICSNGVHCLSAWSNQ